MLKGLGIHDFCIVDLCICAKVDKETERPILGSFGEGERVKASQMFLFCHRKSKFYAGFALKEKSRTLTMC